MLSQHKNIINVPFPTQGLLEIRVNESLFKEIHKVDCIVWGSFGAHSSTPYLQVMFTIESEIIAGEDQSIIELLKGSVPIGRCSSRAIPAALMPSSLGMLV